MQNIHNHLTKIPPSVNKLLIYGSLGLALASVTGSLYLLSTSQKPMESVTTTPVNNRAIIKAVTALGRIEPEGEVVQVSVSQIAGSNRVADLRVKEGDRISRGQIIAMLDSSDRRLAAVNLARQEVKVAKSQLAQVKAGAKQGEIAAQQALIAELEASLRQESAARSATVRRLEAEVRNAEIEYQRYQNLQIEGAVSSSTRDSKRLALETAQASLREAIANRSQTGETLQERIRQAKATLNRIAEVRPTDIEAAKANVYRAEAAVQEAETELELTYVRSPVNGQILKIHTQPGEIVDIKGIAEIGQTDQMYVVAEVYETDINQVKVGQTATIKQRNLPGELTGTVEQIGLLIAKKDILNTDPVADIDARVVEVKIRLDAKSSQRVAGLTNSKVEVVISH
ncbi:MAG TPA: ABC exporter membrane fusion protein [Nostocaceae cyanobacterium]|nr:ABC exporter membrane fusion protein [Nostocaceae cyanobacterium]